MDLLKTTEPVFVPDAQDSTKGVVLNHLNLEQTSRVASLLEIIVCWSIVPVLSFRLSMVSRSKEFSALAKDLPEFVALELQNTLTLPLRSLKVLHACLESRELFQMVVDGSLADIIPAFVRFGFEKTILDPVDVQWCNASFKALIKNPAIPSPSLARVIFLHLSLQPQNPVAIRVLSAAVSMLLCERNDGVYGVLSALLDSSSGTVNLELVAKAAKSIATPPGAIKIEPYMEKLIPQFLDIMRSPRTPGSDKFLSCTCEVFREWSTSYPESVRSQWLLPIASPLLPLINLYFFNLHKSKSSHLQKHLSPQQASPTSKLRRVLISPIEEIAPMEEKPSTIDRQSWYSQDISSWNSSTGIVVGQDVVTNVVSNLSLIVLFSGDNSFLNNLEPVIPAISSIYSATGANKKLELVRNDSILILQRFFKFVPSDRAIRMLSYLCLDNTFDWRQLQNGLPKGSRSTLGYRISSSGTQIGLEAFQLEADPNLDFTSDARSSSQQVVDVLKLLEDTDLAGILFLKLLEELLTTMSISKSLMNDSDELLRVEAEETMRLVILASEKQLRIIHALMPLIEQLGPSVLRNAVQICVFIKSLLESEDEEILVLSLHILQQILETKLISRSEADILLIDLLTPLNSLKNHSSDQIGPLADHCHEEIMKYAQSSEIETSSTSTTSTDATSGPDAAPKRKWVLEPHATSVDDALKMISNPLVPIRAGGLIQLRRYILREDPEALSKLPSILDTFMRHLENDDSYVYLGAIQGLSAIADVQFDLAFPVLVEQYKNSKRPLEIRLNVGESILQVARRLGQALPKYADKFFGALLGSAQRDREALLRASSLSNIAEVCELLRWSLLPYIEEIMAMVFTILQVEKDDYVRRGSVNLLKQLFKGLRKDSVSIISDHLKNIVSHLEIIEESDRDMVMREHARVALNLYHSGLEEAVQEALKSRSQHPILEPQGYYNSLRII
jgi:hypothetical protein